MSLMISALRHRRHHLARAVILFGVAALLVLRPVTAAAITGGGERLALCLGGTLVTMTIGPSGEPLVDANPSVRLKLCPAIGLATDDVDLAPPATPIRAISAPLRRTPTRRRAVVRPQTRTSPPPRGPPAR